MQLKKIIVPNIHNESTAYVLELNKKPLDITVYRIKTIKKYWKRLINRKIFPANEGFFIYKPNGFMSYLITEPVDLIFVNWDERIFSILANFKTNKITKPIPEAKYVYVLAGNNAKEKDIKEGDTLTHSRKKIKK